MNGFFCPEILGGKEGGLDLNPPAPSCKAYFLFSP